MSPPITRTAGSASRVAVTPDGHSPDVWRTTVAAAPRLTPSALVERLVGPGTTARVALVVAGAHPDDEALALGRLTVDWAAFGPVVGVLGSAGEACVDHVMPRPDGLAERRVHEWYAAAHVLGHTRSYRLGLPDGELEQRESRLRDLLQEIVLETRHGADVVVLAAPWRQDPHPDHRAVGRAAAEVADALDLALVEFPVWTTFWDQPAVLDGAGEQLVVLDGAGEQLVVVEHTAEADRAHREALAAFASQLTPLSAEVTAVLPPALVEHHRQQLVLLRAEDPGAP